MSEEVTTEHHQMTRSEPQLSPAITRSAAVLLAGAGASVPLGLPTTRGFVDILERELPRKSPLRDVYDQCKSTLSGVPFELEVLLDHAKSRAESGDDGSKRLQDFLMMKVIQTYADVDPARAHHHYFWLFMFLKAFGEDWTPLPVFTTNYDWAFERLTEKWGKVKYLRLIDGFTLRRTGAFWEPEVFHRLKGSQKWDLVLFKLHGSTGWYRQPSGELIKTTHAEKDPGTLESAVIYPTQRKPALEDDPFATAYRYLGGCLRHAQLCVVLGHSLRDPGINETFADALARNNDLHVMIVVPNPDKARLLNALGAAEDRITFLETTFEYYGLDRNAVLREAIVSRMSPDSIFLRRK